MPTTEKNLSNVAFFKGQHNIMDQMTELDPVNRNDLDIRKMNVRTNILFYFETVYFVCLYVDALGNSKKGKEFFELLNEFLC